MDRVNQPSRFRKVQRAAVALQETFHIALDTLRAHKLRTFLTLLGVILAVTTLVAVISVLNGLNVYVSDKVANLGANALVVDKIGIVTNLDQWTKARKRPPLDMSDYEALRDGMKLAAAVAAEQNNVADVRYGNGLSEDVRILGTTPAFADIRQIEVASGRLLTQADDDHAANVCVIGMDVVNKLMPGVDVLGKEIRAGQGQYQIVGVAKPKGTVLGPPQDNFVMIPLRTYRSVWLQHGDSVTMFVQARGPEWMSAAEDEARVIIRTRRHLRYEEDDNFAIIMPDSLTGIWNRITGNAFGIAIWVTSVFLVVGGIVIMNIMLASVTERTREIGLRKSLGARRKHILLQFLAESALLSATGGLIGILAAYGVVLFVKNTFSFPMETPVGAVILSLGLSPAVGLFFGIFPAMHAAKLDPIEALRADG